MSQDTKEQVEALLKSVPTTRRQALRRLLLTGTALALALPATTVLAQDQPPGPGDGTGRGKGGGKGKGKGGGKGARKGHYGKGSGKGYYNGQEICKEYARNNKRCTYAARTGNPRGCKFYHGSDEEMRAAAARLGWDNRRYDGYEALCVLLWERQHGTAWDAAAVSARGLYASAEQ